MLVDNVTFQTNNMVGNFNYLPNVPAYKPIMNFFLNYPLKNDFTNCPSVVYQNFLREFWSTAIAYDPFLSADESEQRPLREFLIKFLVLNRQRPLTLDFKTFSSSTSLDYNNGKYVANPTPKAVKKELGKIAINPSYLDITLDENFGFLPGIMSHSNFSKNPSKVTDIELMTHIIVVNSQKDSVSPLPLVAKPKKGKSHIVTLTLPKSQGPEVPGTLSKKSKRPKSKKPPTETKVTSPKPMKGSEQSHSVSSGTVPDPQDLKRDIQLAKGNIQPLDMDLISMTSDEDTAKTTQRLEGSLGDKDLGGNIPPTDTEPIHTTVTDPSGNGAKHQHKEVALSYADLKASINQYYNENITHRDQTDKLVKALISSLDKSNTTISDIYKGLDVIIQLLRDINNAVKDDPATNKKIDEAIKTFAKISTQTTEILSLEKIKKVAEEARLIAISKPEVIKVVREEAKKLRINPREAIFTKAVSSQTSGRKRKHMEPEPEVKVPGLECNRSRSKGTPFVNNMVIEESEYGIFFTDVFGDQAFQR
nr:zinc finger, CCHC-type [Tanacetum cinerariifolium]